MKIKVKLYAYGVTKEQAESLFKDPIKGILRKGLEAASRDEALPAHTVSLILDKLDGVVESQSPPALVDAIAWKYSVKQDGDGYSGVCDLWIDGESTSPPFTNLDIKATNYRILMEVEVL